MGIGIMLKSLGPWSVYLSGLGCALMAIGGNVRWALLVIVFMLPLRNFIDRMQILPMGDQFLDIMMFGVLIGWVVHAHSKNRPFMVKSPINGIAVVLVIYTFISMMSGTSYIDNFLHLRMNTGEDHRLQDWKNFCFLPLFYFVTANNALTKKEVWRIGMAMCAAMFIMDYYTIMQIHWYSSLESRYKIKATFQFLGPNEVAAFFNEYTIILLSLFYGMKKDKKRWLLLGVILLNLFCVTFTYSRGAYAGLLVGLTLLFLFKDKKMLIPLVLMVILWQTALPEKVIERIKETKKTGQLDESSQRRLDIWHKALEIYESNPLTGIGFGVFQYLALDLGDTHNIYVKILCEQGMVGMLIFVIVVFCFLREGWRLYRKGEQEDERCLGLGFFICVLVMLVNNFFGDRWSYMEPNGYLWVFAGLVVRMNALRGKTAEVLAGDEQVEKEPVIPPVMQPKLTPLTEKIRKRTRYYDL